jgi:peptide/nickel transport system permease protein
VTEQIFQWPGIGQLTISSIETRDYPVLMAINLLSAMLVMAANLLTDIAYAIVDPRVKYQ